MRAIKQKRTTKVLGPSKSIPPIEKVMMRAMANGKAISREKALVMIWIERNLNLLI